MLFVVPVPTVTKLRADRGIILVKLPTAPLEDILNGNHKQLRGGKGNAAHQQTTNFIYMITRPEISRRTDRETFEISES